MPSATNNRLSSILGPDGSPIERVNGHAPTRAERKASIEKNLLGAFSGYVQSLLGSRQPAKVQAEKPFERHAWVFAAAMVQAQMASQAPFTVFRETPDETSRRRQMAKSAGAAFRPRRGEHRTAIQRHLAGSGLTLKRLHMKGAEADFDHPVARLLSRPNPYLVGNQLMQLTHLWMAIRGECFWVLTDEQGESPQGTDLPTYVWPLSPDCFKPILAKGRAGVLVGWEFRPPNWMPNGERSKIRLDLADVIQFKNPDPNNPLRGISRIGAAAAAVELDLSMRSHARKFMDNSAVPKGILQYEGTLEKEEEEDYRERWEEEQGGVDNAGKVAVLSGGFKWIPVTMSQKDMLFLDQMEWNRDEVLAVMGTPRAVLGITDGVNYATHLGQTRGCWDQTILPMMRAEEQTLDATLFYEYPDDNFGAFDLGQVEALRVGIQEKIEAADKMCGEHLHMPPRVAYEITGLDVPEYEGDDVALVSPAASPLGPVLAGNPAGGEDGSGGSSSGEASADAGGSKGGGTLPPAALGAPAIHIKAKLDPKKRLRALIKTAAPSESKMRRRYRGWVGSERTATLSRFDELVRAARSRSFGRSRLIVRDLELDDLTLVLPDLDASGLALGEVVRPVMAGALDAAFSFTADGTEIGIPVFEIDDERFIQFFDLRETLFRDRVSTTVFTNLRASLTSGIQGGETIQQLRRRIDEVYGLSASPHKTLQIARTETGGFFNGVRDQMFEAQGIEKHRWTDADDEVVREDHVTFGGMEPVVRGTNYLEQIGKSGVLRHAGDHEAPPGQVINCRCGMIAVVDDE